MTVFLRILLMACCLTLSLAVSAYSGKQNLNRDLMQLLSKIETGKIDSAIAFSNSLQKNYPGSLAIKLMYADLQNIQAGRAVSMDPREDFSLPLLEILDELRIRKQQLNSRVHLGKVPDNIVQPHPSTRHIIAIDLSLSKLYLLERSAAKGTFSVVEHHYVSIGRGGVGKVDEGDLKTPVGIYQINGFRPDSNLPELYGFGAFTLDFPNELDQRQGFTGYGIWLHGVPHHQLNRPPLTSEGCVVMRNDLIEHLLGIINRDTTPVILAKTLQWTDNSSQMVLAEELVKHLSTSRPEVVSRDQNLPQNAITLASSESFRGLLQEFWSAPDQPNDIVEIYQYPPHPQSPQSSPIFRVRFLQSNKPENSNNLSFATQYWQKEAGNAWKMILENTAQ